MKKIAGLLVALGLAAPLSVFAFGAIAVDDVVGDKPGDVGYYIAGGAKTKEAARAAALKGCKEMNLQNCRLGVLYTVCGAYASSASVNAWGTGKDIRTASAVALKECGKDCEIIVADCE